VSKAAAVSVSPLTATVPAGKTQQFTATVTGASNVAVSWTVNKVAGGNTTVGTVSATGLYTAPAAVPSPAAVTVAATSKEDSTKSGSATVTVSKPSTGFSISSLSAMTIDPLAVLTVTGTGFTPAGAAIAVVFTPTTGGAPITVPVSVATATTLQVAAPLYFNTTTGTFTAGTFSVQAVQLTSATVSTSNVIAGFGVNAPPAVPSGLPIGTVTSLFLQTSVQVSSSVQANAATKPSLSTVAADQYTYSSDVKTLLTGVNKVVATPTSTTTLATSNGPVFTVNAKVLALSDQLLWARVLQYARQAGIPTSAILPALAHPGDDLGAVCTPADQQICIEGLYGTKMVTFTPSQQQMAASAESFLNLTFLGEWAAAAKSGAGALVNQAAAGLQLGWTAASAYYASLSTPATPPAVPSAPTNAASTVVQNIALSGQGILPATLDAALSNQDANKLLKSTTTAPTGGGLLTGSQFNGRSGYNVLDVFQIINGVPTITEFNAYEMQGVDASSADAINPLIPSGTYNTVGYAYLGPVTCCTAAGCFTIPPVSSSSTSTDKVDAGTTLRSYTTSACTAWGSAAKGSGCTYPACNCEEGTNSFGCSFTCTIPPQSASCGSAALTGNVKETLQ